jgi:hypothetical protein
VNPAYLQQLSIPSLWRSRVQLIPGAGHAPHQEATATFTELLDNSWPISADHPRPASRPVAQRAGYALVRGSRARV